jgi:hypothetical protein
LHHQQLPSVIILLANHTHKSKQRARALQQLDQIHDDDGAVVNLTFPTLALSTFHNITLTIHPPS